VLDLRRIREDPDGVSAALARRDGSLAAVVGEVAQADGEWRAATTSAETLRAAQKARSEEYGAAKARGDQRRRCARRCSR
jgi:seryl-tRNA synthetase